LETEETYRLRVLDGALYVPYLDPRGTNANPENGQLAINNGTWDVVTTAEGLTHGFDVAKTSDGLWLFGADETTDKATVWRSQDDGATWVKSLEVDSDPDAVAESTRFYAALLLGDDLTCYYHSGADADRAFHWNGTGWDEVDTAGPIYGVPAVHELNGTLFGVGISNGVQTGAAAEAAMTALLTPDDTAQQPTVQASLPSIAVFDAYAAGGYLWLLSNEWHVWRGDTTGGWTDLGPLDDTTIRSLAADTTNGYLYFGTTDSRILRTPIPS
jgi:hypothetical protein